MMDLFHKYFEYFSKNFEVDIFDYKSFLGNYTPEFSTCFYQLHSTL